MKQNLQTQAAKEFSLRWKDRGYEKGECQTFWLELLQTVFKVERPYEIISFENRVKLSSTSFIDAYIPATRVLIEQKSIEKDLRKAIKQSDGSLLTPFQQAKRYAAELGYDKYPRWVVICNFKEFHVYDMKNPQGEPEVLLLDNLDKEYYRMQFMVETGNEHLKEEMEVSLQAGEIIGKIYNSLLKQYINPNDAHTLRSLNILCVRLVFCLYAEDAGIFGSKRCMFHDYLSQFKPGKGEMREALIKLFNVLDTAVSERDPYMDDTLKSFPYCNGGLFAQKDIEIPRFNDEVAQLILKHASSDFDWSRISPTIFGAVFESTLNPHTRRSGGMHYTSIENIHKVIDPLFLNGLKNELEEIRNEPIEKKRIEAARKFQDKLSSLKFLDPACGSGNFLTETFLSLRRLENEILMIITKGQMFLGLGDNFSPIKVNINQFYGIEINDFAVATATTALWIAESQMMAETERIMQMELDFLPLKPYRNIIEGNALRMDWHALPFRKDIPTIVADKTHIYVQNRTNAFEEPADHYGEINLLTGQMDFNAGTIERKDIVFDYIMGNPPFSGARLMIKSQKEDMFEVFGPKWKNLGNMDYVSCWYKKACDYMTKYPLAKCALVATNSIAQGEQPANLWKPLMQESSVHIDFAWKTFRWDSESSLKAHVHCVIIGFSKTNEPTPKFIYQQESKLAKQAETINPYLIDSGNIFIESRIKPLCNVPEIGIGNKPIDGGYYLFTREEMEKFILLEPASAKFFRPWYGSEEFIHQKPRWCLWLGDCTPAQLQSMPHCLKRVAAVREYRLASTSAPTRKLANTPTRFHVENMPESSYIIIPETSSERRRYIPIGFMSSDVLCSNAVRLIPNAGLYHFGVLTSNVHMAWMRVVCGRLKSDYRYSKDIVYNNFPWPSPVESDRERIEKTAQAILDARAKYPDSSLADLYDEVTMPIELRKAHQENDKAVMQAYGFNWRIMSESDCVTALFELYSCLSK